MRCIAIVILLATGTAHAEDDGDAFFGLALGPAVQVDGDLAARMEGAGIAARPRFGFRFHRVGFELTLLGSGLADRTHALESPAVMMFSPGVAFYPVATRTFQLLVHGGLGGTTISGSRTAQVACQPPEECTTKSVTEDVSYPGYAVEVGITAQVHLGHGTSHPMLWVDLGWSFTRNQIDTVTTTGRFTLLTIGIADAVM